MSETSSVDLTNYETSVLLVFTDAAANKVKNLIEEENNDELKLRVKKSALYPYFTGAGEDGGLWWRYEDDEDLDDEEDDPAMMEPGMMDPGGADPVYENKDELVQEVLKRVTRRLIAKKLNNTN